MVKRQWKLLILPGLLVSLSLLMCIGAGAQEYRGTLTGVVRDASGAVIPSAQVTVINVATNTKLNVATSTQGVYTVPNLAPGVYSVTVSKTGFKTLVRSNIQINTGQTLGLNLTLEVGAVTQQVTVTAQAPLLNTETGSGGTVLNSQIVSTMPIHGSNTFNLMALTPGANNGGAGAIMYASRPFDNGGEDGYSVNGGPRGGNNNSYLINGVPDNNNEGMGYAPPAEAVSQVNVMTNTYDAEYGRTGGGITSIALKNGGNAIHGEAYVHVQNSYFNAQLSQNRGQKVQLTQWFEPGFQLSGPVYIPGLYNGRDKTFFSVGYEYFWDRIPSSISETVPSLAQRVGNFCSGAPGNNGIGTVIYDPLSTTNPDGVRTAF